MTTSGYPLTIGGDRDAMHAAVLVGSGHCFQNRWPSWALWESDLDLLLGPDVETEQLVALGPDQNVLAIYPYLHATQKCHGFVFEDDHIPEHFQTCCST